MNDELQMADPFQIPGLKKGHSEMFFPEICEIIDGENHHNDIGIYLNF